MDKKNIIIFGLGQFGYAVMKHLDRNLDYSRFNLIGFEKNDEIIKSLKETKRHPFWFVDSGISENVIIASSSEKALEKVNILILAVPSNFLLSTLEDFKKNIKNEIIILNLAKGLSPNGEPFSKEFKKADFSFPYSFGVLSGGNIAKDLFYGEKLGSTIAFADKESSKKIKEIFESQSLYIEESDDIIGVELAGAFKNICTLFLGYLEGKGTSVGTITYYLTQISEEIKNFAVKNFGAKPATFSLESQCWGNDLIMSYIGETRNKEFGKMIGQGMGVEETLEIMKKENKTVEGMNTVNKIRSFDLKDFPILGEIVGIFG
ncbi:MAG: NAD(P)-binding domain-containing protein [Candidatus Gracilibacteria bacterium]|nr:NAD(P)-binding domain-containing protein [Candidatus Gracilibacteria bacterium]MDD4530107.1 NAD(P)-binding domain-containing protein [Candidatus Gracilibacteria bacterium]